VPTRASVLPTVPSRLPRIELTAPGRRAPHALAVAADALDDLALDYRPAEEPTGKAGEVRVIATPAGPNWLVGVGERTPKDWRAAGASLVRAVREHELTTLDLGLPADARAGEIGALTLGLTLGGYRFAVSAEKDAQSPRVIRLRVENPADELRAAAHRAGILAAATALARDLANMPSDVKTPAWLADTAARAAAPLPGLIPTVRDEAWLTEHGFGGVLAVGGGSANPPRLLELAWRPRGATTHLVLVGKGITFDTGGISLKPAAGMHLMRTDMSGGAAVIGALRAVAELGLPVRVTGLVPIAENHVSGSAYRPGDVVRHYGGTTTEVANTDAEGRMVLADALSYAVRRHKPDLLVDVATLTGAMKVSLGVRTGGLFASSGELAAAIGEAGRETGEAWWRMPLTEDYADSVHGDLADLRQYSANNDPGAIFAALFLREFTGGLPWAHLDIAGPARADANYAEVTTGGTGFAARTLVGLAESLVER
jgi:leucyl aminopeptidase